MDNKKTGRDGNDHMGCLYRADWLSRWFLEVEVTNGVSMFILLNIIFFDFSLFSDSDRYVGICHHCIAKQTCLSHNRVFEVTVVDIRLDVLLFVEKKQASQNDSLFCLKVAMLYLLNQGISA